MSRQDATHEFEWISAISSQSWDDMSVLFIILLVSAVQGRLNKRQLSFGPLQSMTTLHAPTTGPKR